MSETRFKVGDEVEKIRGHEYPGIVVATFETTAGVVRHVVESRVLKGLLFILAPDQLRLVDDKSYDDFSYCPACGVVVSKYHSCPRNKTKKEQ